MSEPLAIGVTSANGTVGKEVVRQLSAAGVRVRALVRSPENAAVVALPHVELVQADLASPQTLNELLSGLQRVFLLSPPDPNQVELQGNVIEACRRAGVRHAVKLSTLDAAPDSPVRFLRWNWHTEKQLEHSGIAFTHLRPHYFMQTMLGYASRISSQGNFCAPMKDAKISLVDVRDIAAVAVVTLTQPGHEGKTYDITGPEALSFAQLAEEISAAVGHQVTYMDVLPAVARQGMIQGGLPNWLADGVLELFAYFDTGRAARVTNVVAEVGKTQPRTFEQFAREFAPAFQRRRAQEV